MVVSKTIWYVALYQILLNQDLNMRAVLSVSSIFVYDVHENADRGIEYKIHREYPIHFRNGETF